ncbi:MAG: germination protein YpeB, partial [Clostridia bacterium]|nr:germination protein YpeB [Clostridia bacterium]
TAVTAHRYRTQLEYTYERGLSELSEHLNKIETTLTKGIYAGTAAGATNLAMTLWSESGAAKSCLTQIPTYGTDLANTYKFLSQVGEYSLSLAKNLQRGQGITSQEHQTLTELATLSQTMSNTIDDLCTQMEQSDGWKAQISQVVEQNEPTQAANTLFDSLKNLEETVSDYPTLLYDGPFSEHILQATPKLLENLSVVTETTARWQLAHYLNVDEKTLGEASLMEKGTIPSYVYTNEQLTAAVTRQGGHISYFNVLREVGEPTLEYEECIPIATAFLETLGLGEFKESYYTVSEGICLINFAYLAEDVVCYTDLIKVGVALDNGDIVSYNAQGYIMNHTEREIASPRYTVKDAKKVLSPYVTVKSSGTAIIPLNARVEKLCYEFLCEGQEEEELLIYVNADTLEEESLLIVLKTDGGTLTI